MRQYLFALLLAVQPINAVVHAEEPLTPPAPSAAASADVRISELERQLADAEQQRSEMAAQLESSLADRENAQMAHLRQENQKLKLQVREALSKQPKSPLNEKQTWFLIGASASLLGVLVGALLRGNRKSRRQWIN